MALVHSFAVPNEDQSQEDMDYYIHKIVAAKAMLRLMKTRRYLTEASVAKNKFSLPHNDVTRLERDLMEVRGSLLKLCMNRQLVNIALQKSIQSSLLHSVSRNLFTAERLNFIEDSVAQQMKLMMETGQQIRSLKEEVDQQAVAIAQMEEKLLGRMIQQRERLSASTSTSTSQESRTKANDVTKTINNMNKLAQLLNILVMQGLAHGTTSPEEKEKMVQLAAKWRTPRSLNYYRT